MIDYVSIHRINTKISANTRAYYKYWKYKHDIPYSTFDNNQLFVGPMAFHHYNSI